MGLNTQVLGISIDHVPCLKAWTDSFGGINYPLLSDFWPHGAIAKQYSVFRENEGRSERAIFVIDKQGIIRYIDVHDIDTQPDNEVLFDILRKVDPEAAAAQKKTEARPPESVNLPHGGIVMYCTRWCPACKRARAWFQARNLPFIEVDIDVVPGASDQVRKWAKGNRTTPVFDIDGTILIDFNEQKLLEALKERLPA
jgi:glutaredoxin